jgi:DNA segregation ATPase FtsK/SpoIIIE, S-DNA-T family
MSKVKEIAEKMKKSYQTLQQLVVDAEHYHALYEKQSKQYYEQSEQKIEKDYEEKISKLQREVDAEKSRIRHEVEKTVNNLGIFAAPWDSDLWVNYDPDFRNQASQEADPLTGLSMLAYGYGSLTAVPGGVRVGAIQQNSTNKGNSINTVMSPIDVTAMSPLDELEQMLDESDAYEAYEQSQNSIARNASSLHVPALAPMIGVGNIFIISDGKTKPQALRLLQSIVTRTLVTFPVTSIRSILIDPVGLGDNFPFKRLPESIVGNTVYSEPDEIRTQMRELTEHLKRVTIKYLAKEFDNIEDYNSKAEEVVEAYRLLCVADFPSKFEGDPVTRLMSLAEKGPRTGIYVTMHINTDMQMPRDFDLEALKRTGTVIEATNGKFSMPLSDSNSQKPKIYEFFPDGVPDNQLFNSLMDRVRIQAEKGVFKGIPFSKVAVPPEFYWIDKQPTLPRNFEGVPDTRDLIEVPIGRSGANDILNFWLGKQRDGRISAHALIGGRTGYGKSTLFHALISSLALKYSPEEVELYLVDFKEGVEFKPYADAKLPHARVIAIESEREFGLSVLRETQTEMEQRGVIFKQANAQDITAYRQNTGEKLPRVLLIIDEFQLLFIEQDALTNKASQILDDLARRGRSFGIHIIIGSQSVRVANIPSSTFNQFATRIALQSAEQEIAAILGADNVAAAEIIERPGEVIYNDDGGRRDRNIPGQVALVNDEVINSVLKRVNDLVASYDLRRKRPLIIFRGDRASIIQENEQLEKLYSLPDWPDVRAVKDMFDIRDWVTAEQPSIAWLGEAIEIKPHTAAYFKRRSRSNLLIVGDREEIIFGVLGASFISLAGFYPPNKAQFRIIDLSLKGEDWDDTCEDFETHFNFHDIVVKERRGADTLLEEVARLVRERQELYKNGEEELGAPLFLVIAGAHRMSALRPNPGRFGRDEPSEHATMLTEIIQRGPEVGVHVILWCDNTKTFEGMFGRPTLAHFDRRIALPMSKDDSQYLLGEPDAGRLSYYRAYLMDQEQVVPLEKFKPYTLPSDKTERSQVFAHYADLLEQRSNRE